MRPRLMLSTDVRIWGQLGRPSPVAKGVSLAAVARQPFAISQAQLCALSLAHAALRRKGG